MLKIMPGVLLVVALAACGGSTPGPGSCRVDDQACAATADCCSPLVCSGNRCTAASTCRANGNACAATADCCSGLTCSGGKCSGAATCRTASQACAETSDCCSGLTCSGGTCSHAATCRTVSQACAETSDCCSPLVCSGGKCTQPQTCGGVGARCSAETGARDCCPNLTCGRYATTCGIGGLGDPCRDDVQCSTNECVSWCTKRCSSRANCAAPRGVNECVDTNLGLLCAPFCTGNSDCAIYGATCQKAMTAEGIMMSVCLAP